MSTAQKGWLGFSITVASFVIMVVTVGFAAGGRLWRAGSELAMLQSDVKNLQRDTEQNRSLMEMTEQAVRESQRIEIATAEHLKVVNQSLSELKTQMGNIQSLLFNHCIQDKP